MAKKVTLDLLLTDDNYQETVKILSFEEGMSILEELVGRIERGDLALEKAIASYERGVKLIESLKALLTGAEAKLKVLSK
jgi:exodeoxyribonuclease VII small subunit